MFSFLLLCFVYSNNEPTHKKYYQKKIMYQTVRSHVRSLARIARCASLTKIYKKKLKNVQNSKPTNTTEKQKIQKLRTRTLDNQFTITSTGELFGR